MFQVSMTENSSKVMDDAMQFAYSLGENVIGTEHVLFGLANSTNSVSGQVLRGFGVNAQMIKNEIIKLKPNAKKFSGKIDMEYSPRVKDILITAQEIAYQLDLDYVSTEHMLFAMTSDSGSQACILLTKVFGIRIQDIQHAIQDKIDQNPLDSFFGDVLSNIFGTNTKTRTISKPVQNNAFTNSYESNRQNQPAQVKANINAGLPEVLRDMGTDLTARAKAGKMDPIIGRENETNRIIEILCRKTKNNPVLIGEAGVGKSAVVEGLAQAIVKNNVPELLKGKTIFSLEIGSLMAGTKYRGSMEEKLKTAIDTIIASKDIIVFIDEIHMLAQAGSKDGEVSPADMLKPYLARGELQTIGATTTEEYRKFIEKDRALERRFQPIMVNQPSEEDTIQILNGLRDSYEAFHKVVISDEAIKAAVNLSVRYIMDRSLPDKAIDLIDEASSRAKVMQSVAPKDFKELEQELKKAEGQKKEALLSEDYIKADECKAQINDIREKIRKMQEGYQSVSKECPTIVAEDVAKVVSKWTGIPVQKLTESDKEKLLKLEDELHKRVIGQDEAVVAVSRAIRRARAGLKDPKRPIGSFIFLGPTGVGKTELTKALAVAMFDDENSIVRLDMSEYMEAHSVAKLIGAPPGYVGHDDGGQLTKAVQRKPYCVVLFDEIEKAHPDVFNILLQVLDEGRLTDSTGTTIDFKNTIIIMTSNVGVAELPEKTTKLGFNDAQNEQVDIKDRLLKSLREKFKPEFLNRVDVITIFNPLSVEDITKIATIMISNLNKKLQIKGIKLEFEQSALDEIIRTGYDAKYGARPLKRVLEQRIEDKLAEDLLTGQVQEGDFLSVVFEKDFKFVQKQGK